MPINGFQIRDIGPIKYVKCEKLPSVVIISGANGVGKSTLLEALKKRRGNVSIDGSGKFLYIPPYRAPAAFSLHRSLPFIGPRTRFVDMLTLDSFSFSAPGISLPYYITSGAERSRLTPDFAPHFEVKFKLAQFQQEFEHTLAEVFYKMGGKIPEGLMPKDIYRPFRDFVKRLLPGIEFKDVIIEGETYKVYFKNRTGVQVEFDQLSSGEKDIVTLLFPFIEKEVENELAKTKGGEILHEDLVILIDTPEAYLHPTLQRNLLHYIRSSVKEGGNRGEKLQFFIATHSTTIINEATPEELFVMRFPDESVDGNQITKIATEKEKLHLIRDILGDIGFASLATGKPLLLLEGKNDVEILKLLKPDIEEKFTLLPFGGKGKSLAFTETYEKVIFELASRGFKIFAVLDKDSGLVSPKSSFCYTWPKACIENFLLLDSEAIYEALKVTAGDVKLQEKGIKSKEDVNDLINELIKEPEFINEEIKKRTQEQLEFYVGNKWENLEELRKIAFETLEKKLSRIKERYEKLNEEIKQMISDKEKVLTELSGKGILGRIASKFDIEREILARVIADKLKNLDRVPKQITDLIAQIEECAKK
jgi:AAA15 family ATPase/GTPase